MRKPNNEVLKLVRHADESVSVLSQSGANLMLPEEAAKAMERYFEAEAQEAWIVGALFAPAGSVKRTRLRIVAKALDSQRWPTGKVDVR